VNMILLSLFILQHSLLAVSGVKSAIKNYGMQDLYRSFYVITTTAVLQVNKRFLRCASVTSEFTDFDQKLV
jgi:hypothetical protein